MSDISLNSNSSKALQDIQTLLDRMEGTPEIEPTGAKPEPKTPLTLGGSAPTVPKAPVPAQPEIAPPGPNANPEGGLTNVPKAVDKFVNEGGKLGSGNSGNQPVSASRVADIAFSLMDVILTIQKSAQERRKTSLESLQADRNLKMQHLTSEADAIGKAGDVSATFAYISAGLQSALTLASAGLQVVGVKKQYNAYSESGMNAAKTDVTAAANDRDLVFASEKPGGATELSALNENGRFELPEGMKGTKSLVENGVPYRRAQGEYAQAKVKVKEAQLKVEEALGDVNRKSQALADAKAQNKPEAEIKQAEKDLSKAQETLGEAKNYLKDMKDCCAEKAIAYTEECADFKKTMDADIKAAEKGVKAKECSQKAVDRMKDFRESECQKMLLDKDLKSAFDERVKTCKERLDIASDRFTRGAAANEAQTWMSSSQLAKSVGDIAAAPVNATGGAKDAEEKQRAKIAAAEAEKDQQDADDSATKAKQALDQLTQANELLKFLAETSRATTNRILGA